MVTKSEYERIAQILAILGGIVALIEAIMSLAGGRGIVEYDLGLVNRVIAAIIAIVLAIIVLLSALKPDNPIPFNGILLIILGIVMIIFSSLIGGILVLIAGILLLL
ncbi:MAG: hypothetical protein ACFFG0_42850 [Candidatus Thorarchaeota archaeon]